MVQKGANSHFCVSKGVECEFITLYNCNIFDAIQVEVAWKVFDKDLDGYITKVEFQRMATKANISK